jgi:hypothetical protein
MQLLERNKFIHSLCMQYIQFLLNFSNIINLWVIQCPCKKQTSYILNEIRQYTVVTIFSATHIPGILCQDQECWMNDVGKWHFEKQHTWYNYALFIWEIYFGPAEMYDSCRKMMHARTIEVSLHVHTLATHFYVYFTQTKIWKTLNLLNIILDMYKITKVVTVNLWKTTHIRFVPKSLTYVQAECHTCNSNGALILIIHLKPKKPCHMPTIHSSEWTLSPHPPKKTHSRTHTHTNIHLNLSQIKQSQQVRVFRWLTSNAILDLSNERWKVMLLQPTHLWLYFKLMDEK